jgi:hypothetical protein
VICTVDLIDCRESADIVDCVSVAAAFAQASVDLLPQLVGHGAEQQAVGEPLRTVPDSLKHGSTSLRAKEGRDGGGGEKGGKREREWGERDGKRARERLRERERENEQGWDWARERERERGDI